MSKTSKWIQGFERGGDIPADARTVSEWSTYWDVPYATATSRIRESLRKEEVTVYEGYAMDRRGRSTKTKFYRYR